MQNKLPSKGRSIYSKFGKKFVNKIKNGTCSSGSHNPPQETPNPQEGAPSPSVIAFWKKSVKTKNNGDHWWGGGGAWIGKYCKQESYKS